MPSSLGYSHPVVSEYIARHLFPRLKSFGASNAQIQWVSDDIRSRLISLLSHWSDRARINALLELGAEEASAYEPQTADEAIKRLVVVAVRNSLLEDMASSRPFNEELKSPTSPIIRDAQIPLVTTEAIQYFAAANRDVDLTTIGSQSEPHFFANFPNLYPSAWNALNMASQLAGGERRIPKISSPAPQIDISADIVATQGMQSVITSGIDPRLDGAICGILAAIHRGSTDLVFFPAFKWFTRHTDKLLRVFEAILCAGGRIVTLNYYFAPGVVCKRRFYIRPSHHMNDIASQCEDLRGLCKLHREALRQATIAVK